MEPVSSGGAYTRHYPNEPDATRADPFKYDPELSLRAVASFIAPDDGLDGEHGGASA